MESKEQLIAKLLGLMNGSIAPSDLKPQQLTIKIGYGNGNQYFINDKEVSKSEYDLQASKQVCTGFKISYGGEDE